MSVEIVPATEAHARAMVGRLRAGDAAEVEAVGLDQEAALVDGVRHSIAAWAALVDGEVAAMWGITAPAVLGALAHPWLMTTPLVERHKKRFVRECRAQVAAMRGAYPVLANVVDARYPQAMRLLRWLGFTIADAEAAPNLRVFSMGA